jgi:LPS export ABC transporter protein LptC
MKRASAFFSLPVLLGLGILALWSSRQLEHAAPLPPEGGDKAPQYELHNATWTRLDVSGQREFQADAKSISWFEDKSAHLLQPTISGLGNDASSWTLRAPEGRMEAGSRDLLLTGTVTGNGKTPDAEPVRFSTAHLWVNVQDKHLRTDSDVTLTSPTRQITSSGMNADWQSRHLELLKNVKVLYAPRT